MWDSVRAAVVSWGQWEPHALASGVFTPACPPQPVNKDPDHPSAGASQVYHGFHGGWRWETLWLAWQETGILGLPEMGPSSL